MKRLIIKFLKFMGRLFGVDLYDRDMVFHIEKRYEIEKIDSEAKAIKKLNELSNENNQLSSDLRRSQLDHEGALLREQRAQKIVAPLETEVMQLNQEIENLINTPPEPPPIYQDPTLDNTSKTLKPIKERKVDVKIKFKRRDRNAIAPSKFNKGDAGYDLYTPKKIVIEGMNRQVVDTGIVMNIPRGYYGRVTTRGSISWRDGVSVLSGIVDSGFQNTVKVILFNTSQEGKTFSVGDRVAQIIIEKAEVVEWTGGDLDEGSKDGRLIGSTGE